MAVSRKRRRSKGKHSVQRQAVKPTSSAPPPPWSRTDRLAAALAASLAQVGAKHPRSAPSVVGSAQQWRERPATRLSPRQVSQCMLMTDFGSPDASSPGAYRWFSKNFPTPLLAIPLTIQDMRAWQLSLAPWKYTSLQAGPQTHLPPTEVPPKPSQILRAPGYDRRQVIRNGRLVQVFMELRVVDVLRELDVPVTERLPLQDFNRGRSLVSENLIHAPTDVLTPSPVPNLSPRALDLARDETSSAH
jgi:hypothetical protein